METQVHTLNLKGELLSLDKPHVMGILNVTPDSFFAGSRVQDDKKLLRKAAQMLEEGATFLDIGGYSTRPGADHISPEEETQRVTTAIRALVREFPAAYLSVDTFRASVARAAVEEGAALINDVSGGTLDPEMFQTAADLQVPYILMHMRGTPQTMSRLTAYENVVLEVTKELSLRLAKLNALGVRDIIIDPGFGFAKTRAQNFVLLSALAHLKTLNRPLLIGLSRKSMIYKTLNIKPEDALNGTSILHAMALRDGANILRVHDVKPAQEAIKLLSCLTY